MKLWSDRLDLFALAAHIADQLAQVYTLSDS